MTRTRTIQAAVGSAARIRRLGRRMSENGAAKPARSFGTCTLDLSALADWLAAYQDGGHAQRRTEV
jgi:hypothetical protein